MAQGFGFLFLLILFGVIIIGRLAKSNKSQFQETTTTRIPSEATTSRLDQSSFCPATTSTNDSSLLVFENDVIAQIGKLVHTSEDILHEATSKLEDAIEQQEEKLLKPLFEAFIALLFFKPPTGLVVIICALRLVGKGRIFRRYPAPKNSIGIALERRKRAVKQSYTVDRDDVQYQLHGGVVHVRLLLCSAAMASFQDSENANVQALAKALAVSTHPDGGRLQLVRDLSNPMAMVEFGLSKEGTSRKDQDSKLLNNVALSLQVHQMDALLRLCRDQVITTAYRLAGTKEYWERRVQSRWRVLFGHETIVGDRARLAYAQASYEAEIRRLNKLVELLRKRPEDLPLSLLLEAFKATELRPRRAASSRSIRRNDPETIMSILGQIYASIRGFDLFSYAFRWQGDGRGYFSLKSFDQSKIDERVASALLSTHSSDSWQEVSSSWLLKSRQCISDVVREALYGSMSTLSDDREFFEEELHGKWTNRNKAERSVELEYMWNVAVDTVIGLSMWRRAGEGKVLTPKDSAIVVGFRSRFDLYGIPSTCFFIWISYCCHRWARPRWDTWYMFASSIVRNVARILDRRVRRPFVGLYKEIMHENSGVTAGFGLKREELSLDRMLRDLGYGNGGPSTRKIALQQATKAYEAALRSNVIRSLVSGKLIRLLLIQVQQLKVGVLSAVGRIDVLLKGNQINFRILAAVPAVVVLFYLLRFLWRIIYNIRSQDLRPVTAAHEDMAMFLIKMERILLTGGEDGIGEIILYLHRYLLLLDFSTPPFPKKLSDEIMVSLQSLSKLDDKNDQVLLLRRIQELHHQMAGYL